LKTSGGRFALSLEGGTTTKSMRFHKRSAAHSSHVKKSSAVSSRVGIDRQTSSIGNRRMREMERPAVDGRRTKPRRVTYHAVAARVLGSSKKPGVYGADSKYNCRAPFRAEARTGTRKVKAEGTLVRFERGATAPEDRASGAAGTIRPAER
jgi:hypothetical protein